VCLATVLSPPKMARFSLRHSGKGLNSTKNCVEERASSLERERAHAPYILRMGQMIVRIRQPGRNDDASRRVAPEKAPDPKLPNESCGQVFPWGACRRNIPQPVSTSRFAKPSPRRYVRKRAERTELSQRTVGKENDKANMIRCSRSGAAARSSGECDDDGRTEPLETLALPAERSSGSGWKVPCRTTTETRRSILPVEKDSTFIPTQVRARQRVGTVALNPTDHNAASGSETISVYDDSGYPGPIEYPFSHDSPPRRAAPTPLTRDL